MSPTAMTGQQRITFTVLTVSAVSYAMLQSLVIPVLGQLGEALHTDSSTSTWILTSYLLSASVATPIMGRIGDMIGKKQVFVGALLGLAVGCLISAIAPSLVVMLIGRVIQGVGGGTLPLAFGIIRDEFPRDKVAGSVAMISGITGVGGGLGVVLAGPLVGAFDYHWLFWLPTIITVAAAIVAQMYVPSSPSSGRQRIGWLPAILLSGWLIALLLGVSKGPAWGWTSGSVVGLVLLAVVLAAAWVASELRATTPVIDMQMMRARPVWATSVVGLVIGFTSYALFAFVPALVQVPAESGWSLGGSITLAGLLLVPQTAGSFVTAMLTGRLLRAFGPKWVICSGCLVTGLGALLLAAAHHEKWQFVVATLITGAGTGLTFSSTAAVIVAVVRPDQTGVASGMTANIRTIGGSIGAAVISSIVASHVLPSGLPKEVGFTVGFVILACLQLLGAFASTLIPSKPSHGTQRQLEPPAEPDDAPASAQHDAPAPEEKTLR